MYKIPAKTLFIGKKVIFLPTCHSTNEEAADLLDKHAVIEGAVIITNNQIAGKGQRGNQWITAPGKNLTFSLILKPTFLSIVHQFYLNIAVSLGIADFLNSRKKGFQVKWPNDIYFGDRKIGGILIQNSVKGSQLGHSIIGIGLNINQQLFDEDKPISLLQITGQALNLDEAFSLVNESLEKRYLQLKRGEMENLTQDYLANMYRFGEDHLFKAGEVFHGRITGITEQGLLEIQSNKGIAHFNFKEVEFVF